MYLNLTEWIVSIAPDHICRINDNFFLFMDIFLPINTENMKDVLQY